MLQFFHAPEGWGNWSPQILSTFSRNESFWDGLGPDIDRWHPQFMKKKCWKLLEKFWNTAWTWPSRPSQELWICKRRGTWLANNFTMVMGAKNIDFSSLFDAENLKNFEKRFGNDLLGHLQGSELAYAKVHGWQTSPQWPRLPRIWMFHSFLDL